MRTNTTPFAVFAAVSLALAVSAGTVYPAKTGHATGGVDGGSKQPQRPRDDDRFHMQSPDGQYVFGHTSGDQGRAEMRAKDGTVTGYYSYTGVDGKVVYVNYVADKDGYRVLANAGVPSASVTIEGGGSATKTTADGGNDYQQVFSDFTKRIKDKIVGRTGQTVVDPIGEGQYRVPANPAISYPTKETKPSRHEESNQYPDWNQVKYSTTRNPMGGNKHNEGQQQREIEIDPNWDSVKITTQKSNIKENDNDGQGSIDNRWWSATTTTETAQNPIPLVPSSTQISIENDVPTTISYYDDRSRQTTENINQRNFQTTISGVKRFDESSTVAILESETERYRVVKDNEEKIKDLQTDAAPTTIRPQETEPLSENVPITERSSPRTQTTNDMASGMDYTTIAAVNERVTAVVGTAETTTHQPDGNKFGDTETTMAADIQHVTEEIEHRPEFRTLEPAERMGTTEHPNSDVAAQVHEIVWPEIPQAPVPQVLVPLDPYSDEDRVSSTKTIGVKTHQAHSRLTRHYKNLNESIEVTTANVTETAETTETTFNFPTFFITG